MGMRACLGVWDLRGMVGGEEEVAQGGCCVRWNGEGM